MRKNKTMYHVSKYVYSYECVYPSVCSTYLKRRPTDGAVIRKQWKRDSTPSF